MDGGRKRWSHKEDFSTGELILQRARKEPSCLNGRLSCYSAFCNYTEVRPRDSEGHIASTYK